MNAAVGSRDEMLIGDGREETRARKRRKRSTRRRERGEEKITYLEGHGLWSDGGQQESQGEAGDGLSRGGIVV